MEAIIRRAIETGEIISVKYMGGSTPGLVRRIAPSAIDGDKVRALCCESEKEKTYLISALRDPGNQRPRSDPVSFVPRAPVEKLRFAAGWKWAIPEAMRAAIGIHWLPRVQAGNKVWKWIDTGIFAFAAGDTLYDHYTAYLPSGDPRVLSKHALQVLEAQPMATEHEGGVTVQWYTSDRGRLERVSGGLRSMTQISLTNLLRDGVPLALGGNPEE